MRKKIRVPPPPGGLVTLLKDICKVGKGIWPVLYDCWKMMHKKGTFSIDASLRILAGTRSGPEVLAGLPWHGEYNI